MWESLTGSITSSSSKVSPPSETKTTTTTTTASTATTTTTTAISMAPPPNRAPTEERHMNDTTMPPPPRYTNTVSTRKPAVDIRARGPRFGLHDWKRLLANTKDLAQRKGAPLRRDITLAEVKQHNKVYDGWTILRGKVYNLGPYLPYHPGGQDILKGILGKDSTKLFDKYHRWVNIDGLIGPLLLGTVATDAPTKPSDNPFSVVPPKESHLINAPRLSAQAASGTSLLADPESDDDDDEDEDQILPAP